MTKLRMRWLRLTVWFRQEWESKTKQEKYVASIAVVLGFVLLGLVTIAIWDTTKESSVWELVPDDAIMVLETNKAHTIRQKLDSLPFWQPLRSLPYLQSYHSRKTLLDSVARDSLDFMRLLKGKHIYVSLHQTSRTSADILFFVPIPLQERLINSLRQKIQEQVRFSNSKRIYHDIEIHELTTHEKKNNVIFTYAIYNNFFIGSYTPFLVEDAVRKIQKEEGTPFFKENKELLKLTRIDEDDANLYVNVAKLPTLFSLFGDEECSTFALTFEKWAKSAVMDVMMKEHLLVLNGHLLTQEEGAQRDYLSLVQTQDATSSLDLQQFIPQETAMLFRLGFSNKEKYFHELEKYRKEYFPKQIESKESLIDMYSFSPVRFLESIGNEIAVAVLEMPDNKDKPEKLAFIKVKDKEISLNLLKQLAENALIETEDAKPLTEIYEELPITRIEVADFPKKLFGEGFSGFSQSYFTVLEDKYIVVASSFQAMQKLIDDYKDEKVWGKLVRQRQFFEQIGDKSTLSVIIDLPRSWNWLMTNLSEDWKPIFETHKYEILKIEFLAWQALGEKDRFSSSVIFQQQKTPLLAADESKELNETTFNHRLESRPFLVRNHIDRSQEVLVQDEKDVLYLISKEGKILWNYYLSGALRPQVYQLDIYNNGKLQYLIATPNKVYLIDRLGRAVTGFPISFPENTFITHLSVIDYDNSKNYRIAVSDSEGNIYLYDKTGQGLPGWQPRKLGMALAAPLEHVRAGSRDAMIAIQQDGIVNLIKRNSKMYDEFPLSFEADISNDFYVENGNTLADTKISMLTEIGELIEFNLEGKLLDRRFFEKGEQGAIFTLATDKQRKQNFIIARQDSKKLTVYSSEEKLLFSKTFENDGTKLIQYFNFGASLEVVAVTDMHAQKTYLFYTNGTLIGRKPIESSAMIAMSYSEQNSTFTLYRVLGNKCQRLTLGR